MRISDWSSDVCSSDLTAAKFSAKFLHVFKDDKSLAAAVIFPIGVIALHRWAFHMVHHEMVEARLYCTDIDLVMQARKIRLDAKLFRDAGIFADSIQRHRDKHLAGVAVDESVEIEVLNDDSWIFVDRKSVV